MGNLFMLLRDRPLAESPVVAMKALITLMKVRATSCWGGYALRSYVPLKCGFPRWRKTSDVHN